MRQRARKELARHHREKRREDRVRAAPAPAGRRPRLRSRVAALPLATTVAPASMARARPPRVPPAGSASREAIVQTGNIESSAAIGPVRQIRRRERLRGDPARLGQLQRDLAGGAELDAPPDHVHPTDVGETPLRRSRPLARVTRATLTADPIRRRSPSEISPSALRRTAGHPGQGRQRVEKRLRRRDRALRPGRERESRIGRVGKARLGSVRDRDRERPFPRARFTYSTTSGVSPDCESAMHDRVRGDRASRRSRR